MPSLVFAELGGHLTEVLASSELLERLQNLALLFAEDVVALVVRLEEDREGLIGLVAVGGFHWIIQMVHQKFIAVHQSSWPEFARFAELTLMLVPLPADLSSAAAFLPFASSFFLSPPLLPPFAAAACFFGGITE